ncbi:MAG TPA: ABC transporter substrate-binding protein, partial [Ferruginibacter sp.]|nr:ABC transporter substrate-binding protein [Ferruginibacter sp.]
MHTRAGLFCCLLICGMAVASCTRQRDDGHNIFRYNESAGVSSLDPAMARNQANMWPVHQLFNTLVELDSQMQIKPSLAKRWELSEDQLQLRFYLRDDVFFHDDPCFPDAKGRKMTAQDVAFSLQRIIDPL